MQSEADVIDKVCVELGEEAAQQVAETLTRADGGRNADRKSLI